MRVLGKYPQRIIVEFRRLVYGMAFFHGVALERKHYGAMGWNEISDFNRTDLEVSLRQLKDIFFLTPRDEKDEGYELAELGATLAAIRSAQIIIKHKIFRRIILKVAGVLPLILSVSFFTGI